MVAQRTRSSRSTRWPIVNCVKSRLAAARIHTVVNEVQIVARRADQPSHAILCGACSKPIADASDGVLTFVAEAEQEVSWVRSIGWRPDAPGGLWVLAPRHDAKHPPLGDQLEVLPAIVECPFCNAANLLDPEHLILRPNQWVARAHRGVRLYAQQAD